MAIREPRGHLVEEGRAPYTSTVRSGHARATRRAIVAAAAELFVERGYAATTIDAISHRAGVGRKTVFSSVGGKGALLKLAHDWAIAGDDEPIPMAERPAVQAMLAEQDPARLVRMWVDTILDVGARATPIAVVILAAADVDAEARALSDLIRRESRSGANAFVTHLAGVGGLRPGLSIERAADTCWALVNSLLQHLLVTTRAWSLPDYRDWLVRVVSTSLLPPEAAPDLRSPAAIAVVDNVVRERYEATVDGRAAGHLAYQRSERLVVLLHTEVDRGFDDHGVAGALVSAALDDVRTAGTARVVPACPYVTWWLSRHPGYAALRYDAGAD